MRANDKLKYGYLYGIFSVAFFLVAWEIAGRFKLIDPMFISYPSRVLADGFALLASGKITPHLSISLKTILLGFFLAVASGSLAGMIIGHSKRLYALLRPYVYFLNSFPKIAVVPLIIIWFGVGFASKVAVVYLMALVPVLMSAIDGSRNADPELMRMAKSFRIGKVKTLVYIVFFSALPFIFSGMRISAGRAVIGLVVAEVFGYGKGLGYLLSFYGANFQTSRLMFVILIFFAINMSLVGSIAFFEKKLVKWKN